MSDGPVAATATTVAAVVPTPGDRRAAADRRDGRPADRRVLGGSARINREATIPHGFEQLEAAGNLQNFRLAAQAARRRLPGARDHVRQAVPVPRLRRLQVARGRRAGSWAGRRTSGSRRDGRRGDRARRGGPAPGRLPQHLRPGPDARQRVPRPAVGPRALLHRPSRPGGRRLAPRARRRSSPRRRERACALRRAGAGPGGRDGIDGHPEIEMALVELFRVTGERRYLELATPFIDRRGQGCSAMAGSGAATGRTTCRSATRRRWPATPSASCTSTAARSTSRSRLGDDALLDAVHRRWRDMVATRTYLTGGARQPPQATRRSATRSSCRRTGPTRRRAPRSRA